MKNEHFILIAIMAVTFALAGCQKSGVDTSKLENSFQSAEPAVLYSVATAVSEIKSNDYAGAMAELKSVTNKTKLTPKQQQAVSDAISQLQHLAPDNAK